MTDFTTFQRDGLSLRVRDTHGSGLPVIFQHGLCGDINQPFEVFPRHGGNRLITVECRGHGESAAGDVDKFSIATFAEDVHSYAVSRNISRYVVGGISMGAAIALRLACKYPDAIAGLVLARPAWASDNAPVNTRANILAGMLLAEYGGVQGLEIFERSNTAKQLARDAPDNLASMRSFFTRQNEHVTAELLQRISVDGPGVSIQDLAALATPTLVIGHGRDATHPLPLAQYLAGLIPTATLQVITPKADSKPRYVADFSMALDNFLKGLT
jgi:pimeloyl-ACP methyl ester carboxylesterase